MLSIIKSFSVPQKIASHILVNSIIILIFTILYWSIGTRENFTFNNQIDKELSLFTALYIAFSNQVTIGYSNIVPHSTLSRFISMLQFVFMLIYLCFGTII